MVEKEKKSSADSVSQKHQKQSKTQKSVWAKLAILAGEGALIIVVLSLLAGVILLWRVHNSPLDIGFSKDYVEDALSNEDENRVVKVGDIQLHWPSIKGPLLLALGDVFVQDSKGMPFAHIDEAAVGVVASHLLFGKISPSILILRRPSLKIVRDEEGDIDFGFENSASVDPGADNSDNDAIEDILSFVAAPEQERDKSSVLANLSAFKIEGALVNFEGRRNGIQVSLPSFDVTFRNPNRSDITQLNISSTGGSFQYEGVYSKPVELQKFSLSAQYDAGEKKLEISNADVTLGDVAIRTTAELKHDEQALGGALRVEIDEVLQSQIAALWPEILKDDNSAKWIVERMSEGVFRSASADMKLIGFKNKGNWIFDVQDIVAGWDFENLTVNYRDPLTPVTQADGRGSFDNQQEKIEVFIDKGRIGALDVTDAQLEFVNIIQSGKGKADINLKLDGPLAEIFDYVKKEPIEARHDFDPAQVKGSVRASVNIVFPTVDDMRTEDVKLYIIGEANDVLLPDVVGDLDLTGGPFAVKAKNNVLSVSGEGFLDGQVAQAKYETFFDSDGRDYQSRVEAKMIAKQAMRERLGIDLIDFMSGPAGVDVVYTEYQGAASDADIKVDLTPSVLSLKPFAYLKPAGVQGQATLKAVLDNGDLRSVKSLNADAPNLKISNAELAFRGSGDKIAVAGGKFSDFKAHETQGNLKFEVLPSGQHKIILNGPVLDARPFLNDEEGDKAKPYTSPPMLISVNVDKMITEDNEAVAKAKLYLDIDDKGRFNQLEMDALAGRGDIYLRYKPDANGVRTFQLEADDAGATLKAFGIYDKIIGGTLNIFGEPVGRVFDRNFKGTAEMLDFKVVKAPGLARLLSAISLTGVTKMLSGEGLTFTKLQANFEWLFRPEGSLLVLKDGRTSGNSLGLTFDGTFDNAQNVVDVTGTIVPLSGVNKAIGSIPIVGDILTGGGALIAATYSFKGPGDDPKVSVNPLSVLTPGILRRILFEQN